MSHAGYGHFGGLGCCYPLRIASTFLRTNLSGFVLEFFRSNERANSMNASGLNAGAEVTRVARPSRSAVPAMRTQASANPIHFIDEQRAKLEN